MSEVKWELSVENGNIPHPTSPHIISCQLERPLKDENELSMKVFQEAMIQSCVEVPVRETKRQCRIHMISTEHNTSVRITDDVSLLKLDSSFRNAILEQNENWSKMEKANGAIWREILVS